MMEKWKGIFPAITTKFTSDGNLDLDAFERSLLIQFQAGISGIILGGSLGEASTLESKEKTALLSCALQVLDGKVPVLMNIAEQSTAKAVEEVRIAEKNGAQGIMLLPPMRYHADARETVTYFETVAKNTSLPIMLYNNPIDYKINISLEMFEALAEQQNIVAVKESSRDITNITRMRNQFGDRYRLFTGVDTIAAESLFSGADGWVAGLVCAFPNETVAIYNLIKAGQFEAALKINRWFMPLLELDISPKLVQNIKLAEFMLGIGNENVRPPRLPLEGEEREKVMAIIEQALLIRPDLSFISKENLIVK